MESHEGVDTYRTDRILDRVHTKIALHLSGTPFKAIAKGKFSSDGRQEGEFEEGAIFNYTLCR